MCTENDGYIIPWWSKISDIHMEIFREGIRLTERLLRARANNEAMKTQLRILSDVCLPIINHDGRIPQTLQFVELCENLGINHLELPNDLREHLGHLTESFGTREAGQILELSQRQVRRLITTGLLRAEKLDHQWLIQPIDVLRLAVKRLPS